MIFIEDNEDVIIALESIEDVTEDILSMKFASTLVVSIGFGTIVTFVAIILQKAIPSDTIV